MTPSALAIFTSSSIDFLLFLLLFFDVEAWDFDWESLGD
jgi:hypothetical protein